MKGRFLALWTAAVLATSAAFVVHLTVRFETVRLGYEVGGKRKEQRRLVEEKRLLSIEAATLRQAARVETVARGSLQMEQPDRTRIIPVRERQERAVSGRAR
ncbi:MAG: cell division protein FtsL [Myxococcales bacterium]|nr:cell division protein FtsL [Myxococcales bacterium]